MSEDPRQPDDTPGASSSGEPDERDVLQDEPDAESAPDAPSDTAPARRTHAEPSGGEDDWRDPSSARPGPEVPARREPAPGSGYPPSDPPRDPTPQPGVPGYGTPPAGLRQGDRGDEAGRFVEFEEATDWQVQPQERPKPRTWINVVLFVVTSASILWWSYLQYQFFYLQADDPYFNPFALPEALIGGLPYGLAVIAFLLSHEMGHYLACRWYDIDATLPYFIPVPAVIAPLLPGTMGAVIRIIAPIKSRRALFDIAVAGPIAGFVVSLPILAVGLSQSRVISSAQTGGYLSIGEPLIWGPMAEWFGPATGPNEELLVHPLAYVGWFAMLVTAMNLLPVGQLDGGHLMYALFPKAHRAVSVLVLGAMVVAGWYWFPGWIVFALIIFFLLGIRHPRPQRFEALGGKRLLLALVSAAILASSFILVPVRIGEFVG